MYANYYTQGFGEYLLGATIVTPIRNGPGHFRSPHAMYILCRVIPNSLPTGKKAEVRLSVVHTNTISMRNSVSLRILEA